VLPEEFFQLENLIDVDLSTNQITVIPPNITLLKNLKRINLKNNPLKAEGIAPLNNLRDCEVLK
jgi:Leucine-rich repeat (LRR) protein